MKRKVKIIITLCIIIWFLIIFAYVFKVKYIGALSIQSKNVFYINKGEKFNILDNIVVVNNDNKKIDDAKVTVKGELDTTKPGSYNLELKAHLSPFYTGKKEVVVTVKNKSSLKSFIEKIQGYWYYSPNGNTDNFQLIHFQFKEKGCYYGDLSWGGYLNFKYINDDSTFATGDVNIKNNNKTWKEKFEISIGDKNDGLLHVKFVRGNKTLIDDDVKYVGETSSEATRWIHGY